MKKHTMSKAELINNRKYIQAKIQSLIPQVYASLVITLADYYGWEFDDIKRLIEFNQDVWNKCNEEDVPMLKKCSDEYGIDLVEIVGGDNSGECKRFE